MSATSRTRASGSRGRIDDGQARTGADPRGAGIEHGEGGLGGPHASRRLDAHERSDDPAHQRDILHRCTCARKAGRRLHEIGAGLLAEAAGQFLPRRVQQAGLDDDLQHLAGRGRAHRCQIFPAAFEIALDQGADVDHHIDLFRASGDDASGLVGLHIRAARAQRKADDRARPHRAASELAGDEGRVNRVHADRREAMGARLEAIARHLGPRGVRLQDRVVDQSRQHRRRSRTACIAQDPVVLLHVRGLVRSNRSAP